MKKEKHILFYVCTGEKQYVKNVNRLKDSNTTCTKGVEGKVVELSSISSYIHSQYNQTVIQ
jgi:hypothetical protein